MKELLALELGLAGVPVASRRRYRLERPAARRSRFAAGRGRRLRETVDRQAADLAEQRETVEAQRRRLELIQRSLDAATWERIDLERELAELRAYRDEAERLSAVLADALREQRGALAALERALAG